MDELLYYLVVFVATIISVFVLGVIAGFSPTLYIAQVAISSKSKRSASYTFSLTAGVVAAILALIILFQIFHLDTLLLFINTTVKAVTVSVIFNVLVGLGFIFGGFWYLRHPTLPKPKENMRSAKRAGGLLGVFGLGFLRTITSISGLTATYIAGNIISSLSTGAVERLVYTIIFLAATIVPFMVITEYMRKNPDRLIALTQRIRNTLKQINYRLIVGVTAIILGSSIIIINVMMALFY